MADRNYFDMSAIGSTASSTPISHHTIGLRSPPSDYLTNGRTTSPLSGTDLLDFGSLKACPRLADEANSPQLSTTFQDFSISRAVTNADTCPDHASRPAPKTLQRAEVLESAFLKQVTPDDLKKLFHSEDALKDSLVLDIRTRASFEKSRLPGAINISVPAILLKRPLYTISKVASSLELAEGQKILNRKLMRNVVVYDSDSFNVGPGTALYQIAKKFCDPAEKNEVYLVKGGHAAVSRDTPDLLDQSEVVGHSTACGVEPRSAAATAGQLSCQLPDSKTPVNPFFNNIRQNQDLIGGVGRPIGVQVPPDTERFKHLLPSWLRDIVQDSNRAQTIANKFLKIEQAEQTRMQQILKAGVSIGQSESDDCYCISAGIERGDKNRYNNIWPFEKYRVKLLDNSLGDYVNASYLHASQSEVNYIATQGPLPATARDFWQVVWENEVSTIVMLTKIVEGGQAKCHKYWDCPRVIEPFQLELREETQKECKFGADFKIPITIRKFLLRREDRPLQSAQELTQIQFCEWPDLHIVEPAAVLALIAEVDTANESELPHAKRRKSVNSMVNLRTQKPILAHCSAGCGRTGVFCTMHSVIKLVNLQLENNTSKDSTHEVDLVEKTVREFREQRLSMVQTLRQFVLCYDAILLYSVHLLKNRSIS